MIKKLICNSINYTKSMHASYYFEDSKPGLICVEFRTAIPKWCNDVELIKTNEQSILYCSNKKNNLKSFRVDLKNVNDTFYPKVSNNKFFCEKRIYNIIDWVNNSVDYLYFLKQEREKCFREMRGKIKLEEIGELSKEWEDINNGVYHNDIRINYGQSKISYQDRTDIFDSIMTVV